MCWASFVYLIKICREGTRPVSFLSMKQWYLFFWSVLINTRYLPSLHILERVQTYKEIIISIISSFSFTPKAQAHSQDHYLAPTDILSIFLLLSLHCWPADHYAFFLFKILYVSKKFLPFSKYDFGAMFYQGFRGWSSSEIFDRFEIRKLGLKIDKSFTITEIILE